MFRIPNLRRVRNRVLARTRHSEIVLEWLTRESQRLEMTVDDIYDLLLDGKTAREISNMPTPEEDPNP